jgi:hypothetical protein
MKSLHCISVATIICLLLPALSGPVCAADPADSVVTRRVILSPREAADDFGKRIARSHLAVQVTVANTSKDKDLIIEHASLDLTKALTPARIKTFQTSVAAVNKSFGLNGDSAYIPDGTAKTSSVDLQLLQGVIQKGQHYDARNQAYRAIVAIGTVGAGLVGVAGLGPVLPRAVAAWSGPGLTAFSTLFPDLTVDEVIRLSDQAYTANIVVPKQKSKVFVVFMPLDLIMNASEKKQYWAHPSDFISLTTAPTGSATSARPDLSQLEVEIQYDFIVPANDIPPLVTDVVFDTKELDNFAAIKPIHGSVVGRFLDMASVSLVESEALGLTIALDTASPSDDNRVNFVITPKKVVAAGSRLTFQVTKGKQVTSFSKLLTHHLPAPTLTSPLDPAKGSPKSDVAVKLVGSGFFDGDVSILFDGSSDATASGIKINNLAVKDASNIEVTFSIDEKAKIGDRQVQVLTSGGLTGMQKFSIVAADTPAK